MYEFFLMVFLYLNTIGVARVDLVLKNAHLPKIHASNSMNDKYLKVKVVESSWWKCHIFDIQDTGDKGYKQRKIP